MAGVVACKSHILAVRDSPRDVNADAARAHFDTLTKSLLAGATAKRARRWSAARLVDGVVRRLLEPGWRRWASLSDLLPLLAEAAPEVFLDRLEEPARK